LEETGEIIMRSFNFHKLAAISALGLALVAGVVDAKAQGRGQIARQQERIIKQQQKVEKERLKLEQERLRMERERMQARNSNRFRVYRNGSWYNTDRRGADLLRNAVQEGYRQGFQAGVTDRRNRRGLNWGGSNVYRSGTFGWQSHVDRGQYQHYFQQGFQRGYQDGFNNRNQFGSNNNGGLNVLSSILGQLLDIRQY
jgi:flagellar biosynthesis/type III secretory pathway protein FliH